MSINLDSSVIDKLGNPPSRKLEDVSEIVIHHTAGGENWKALRSWILSDKCERKEQFQKFVGLTHYYIDKDGTTTQIFFLDKWTYHSCSGKHDKETIGIELVHEKGEFTDAQYTALFNLIEHITSMCPIKTIVSHDYNYMKYSKKTKGCPSAFFRWDKINEMLRNKSMTIVIRSIA